MKSERYTANGLDILARYPQLAQPQTPAQRHGAFCQVVLPDPDDPLAADLHRIYGRTRLALKIFHKEQGDLSSAAWGKGDVRGYTATSLVEATVIQNLFALDDVAPRVYGLAKVGDCWAQVMHWADDLPVAEGNIKNRLAESKGRFGVKINHDTNEKNVINGRWVDFQGMHFVGLDRFKADVMDRAERGAAWGSRPEVYQDIPQWGVVGQRDCARRITELGLEGYDFKGHDVLDAGCNVGTMSRLLADNGARRVVGFDKLHVARVAAEIHALLGYWNIDALGGNFRTDVAPDLGIGYFDLVLWLSQWHTLRIPEWATFMTPWMIFEGHVGHHERTFRESLEERFDSVEYRNKTRDHGPRPLFWCRKDKE